MDLRNGATRRPVGDSLYVGLRRGLMSREAVAAERAAVPVSASVAPVPQLTRRDLAVKLGAEIRRTFGRV